MIISPENKVISLPSRMSSFCQWTTRPLKTNTKEFWPQRPVGWSAIPYTKSFGFNSWWGQQGTYLGCRFNPWLGHMQEATDWVSLSLWVSLALSLSLPPDPLCPQNQWAYPWLRILKRNTKEIRRVNHCSLLWGDYRVEPKLYTGCSKLCV